MTGENNSWNNLKPYSGFGNRKLDKISRTNFSYIKPQEPLRNKIDIIIQGLSKSIKNVFFFLRDTKDIDTDNFGKQALLSSTKLSSTKDRVKTSQMLCWTYYSVLLNTGWHH